MTIFENLLYVFNLVYYLLNVIFDLIIVIIFFLVYIMIKYVVYIGFIIYDIYLIFLLIKYIRNNKHWLKNTFVQKINSIKQYISNHSIRLFLYSCMWMIIFLTVLIYCWVIVALPIYIVIYILNIFKIIFYDNFTVVIYCETWMCIINFIYIHYDFIMIEYGFFRIHGFEYIARKYLH